MEILGGYYIWLTGKVRTHSFSSIDATFDHFWPAIGEHMVRLHHMIIDNVSLIVYMRKDSLVIRVHAHSNDFPEYRAVINNLVVACVR